MLRAIPAANVLLGDPGVEGWLQEVGYEIYDIPSRRFGHVTDDDPIGNKQEWLYDISYRNPVGAAGFDEPSIESFRDIGVVAPKGRTIERNTGTSGWLFSGGLWQTTTPLKPPRATRLTQYGSTPNTVWRADGAHLLPFNPNLAITVQRLNARYNNDNTNYPPKVQVVVGDWTIRFADTKDAGIWQRVAGRWRQIKQLSLSGTERETVIWICVRRGCVCFSFDEGKKWEIARWSTTPFTILQGSFISFEGVSCQASFGWHELAFDPCWYLTYEMSCLEEHFGSPFVDLTQTNRPSGTSIVVTPVPSSPATMRWRTNMAPIARIVATCPNLMWDVPEVWGTLVGYPPVLAAPVGGYTDLTALGAVERVHVFEDSELKHRDGELQLLWDPEDTFAGNYGLRVVDIDVGYMMQDGSFDLVDRCMMYVLEPSPHGSDRYETDIRFGLTDLFYRAVTTKVDGGWRPLDNLSCIDARNYIILKMGLNSTTRCDWYNTGLVLSNGLPDQPRWWPPEGTTAQDLFDAIDLYEGVETFIDSTGIWTSQPATYIDPVVNYTINDYADVDSSASEIKYGSKHDKVQTAFLVKGKDDRGAQFWATSIDYALERNHLTPGFVGWRIWDMHDNLYLISLAEALVIVNQIRLLKPQVPQTAEITLRMNPRLFRRMRVKISEAEEVGIDPDDEFKVESISLDCVGGSKSQTKMQVTALRVF